METQKKQTLLKSKSALKNYELKKRNCCKLLLKLKELI